MLVQITKYVDTYQLNTATPSLGNARTNSRESQPLRFSHFDALVDQCFRVVIAVVANRCHVFSSQNGLHASQGFLVPHSGEHLSQISVRSPQKENLLSQRAVFTAESVPFDNIRSIDLGRDKPAEVSTGTNGVQPLHTPGKAAHPSCAAAFSE